MMTDELFEMDAFGLAVNLALNLKDHADHRSAAMDMGHHPIPINLRCIWPATAMTEFTW